MKISKHTSSPKSIGHGSSSSSTHSSTSTPRTSLPSSPSRTPSQDRFSSAFTSSRAPTQNPHLANPADAAHMRPQIAQQAQNHPSFYGRLVGMVNGGLQQAGVGISPASHQSVLNNLQQVHAGTMSQGTAHFLEAGGFAQDAVNSFAHGRLFQGAVESSGVALNTVGGIGMSTLQGLAHTSHGPTPAELAGNDPW